MPPSACTCCPLSFLPHLHAAARVSHCPHTAPLRCTLCACRWAVPEPGVPREVTFEPSAEQLAEMSAIFALWDKNKDRVLDIKVCVRGSQGNMELRRETRWSPSCSSPRCRRTCVCMTCMRITHLHAPATCPSDSLLCLNPCEARALGKVVGYDRRSAN